MTGGSCGVCLGEMASRLGLKKGLTRKRECAKDARVGWQALGEGQ
jgi:hypothetical protein